MSVILFRITITVLLILCSSAVALGGTLEVAHWWTSAGEARAVNVIKEAFNKTGHSWKDFVMVGGAGHVLTPKLKAMAAAGSPPGAVQVFMGPNLNRWAEEGLLIDLTDVARAGEWQKVLPPLINRMIMYEGRYYGAPTNAHRVNSMWVNPRILSEAGASIPRTWDEFIHEAEKIKKAGYIPLALGGQAWQEATLFENIVLGVGGVEFHRKAFIEHDRATLAGPVMVECFEMLRKVLNFVDPDFTDRNWDAATKMVMDGRAAMQIMGDWAKGEFLSNNLAPGKDFVCMPAPGTSGIFLILTDTFAMFKTGSTDVHQAQFKLAATIMDPEIQRQFNLFKGAIPARLDIDCRDFDSCGCEAMVDFARASKDSMLVPSFAYYHTGDSEVTELMIQLINTFIHSTMSAREAADKMAAIALLAM